MCVSVKSEMLRFLVIFLLCEHKWRRKSFCGIPSLCRRLLKHSISLLAMDHQGRTLHCGGQNEVCFLSHV